MDGGRRGRGIGETDGKVRPRAYNRGMTDRTPPAPSLAQLRALIAVADAGGFGEAAAEYGVSQSSLSEAVAKLEALAGRPLLRRTPGGTVPTEAGARVLTHARAAVQAAADALLAAQEENGGLSGTLRVASMRSAATHLLPPALAAFRARHPRVTVALLDSDAGGEGRPPSARAGPTSRLSSPTRPRTCACPPCRPTSTSSSPRPRAGRTPSPSPSWAPRP